MSSRHRAIAALVFGAIFATAAPPFDLAMGILGGLVGLALVLSDRTATTRTAARRGFLFGVAVNVVALRFVPEVIIRFTGLPAPAAWLALLLLSLAQALPWLVLGVVARTLIVRFRAPRFFAFAVAAYVATFVFAVFPFTAAGGLTAWSSLLQTADIVGERGVVLFVALGCGLVADGRFVVAATLFVGMTSFGTARIASVDAERTTAKKARVALVQPDFDAFDRWNADRATFMMRRLTDLTKTAESRGTDLVVWPESAYPFTITHGARLPPRGQEIVGEDVQGPVLTGAYTKEGAVGYNSAILATTDGSLSPSYDKRHLLWFGETIPFADVFPVLRRIFMRGAGLAPGEKSIRFDIGDIHAAVLNCYEDTLPGAGREAMAVAPNLLVNITNDAWFVGSAEGELHLRLATLRAIESRRDFVRAVNRGPTSFVDATGRVRARIDATLPASLPVSPALLDGPPTFYARFGDAPGLLLVALAIVLQRRRARNAESAASPLGKTAP